MKYLAPLCAAALLLGGCGKKEEPQPSAESATTSAEASPAPPADTAAAMAAAGATVQLAATQGHTAAGTLNVAAEGDGVRITGTVQGLPPNGEFGFHIHEKGDCSAPDASSAGPHFNPANAEHGNPEAGSHHAGDMLNVKSDAQGVAQVDVRATGVSLHSSQPHDVAGRAVVLHEKADDYQSQPAGNSGARIACGVITAAGT